MSNRSATTSRDERTAELSNAGREYGAAAVMLHGLVAERFVLSATDLKALDILQRLGVMLTENVQRSIEPLFRGLNRRMLHRFRRCSDRDLMTIRDFLVNGAQEMREEAQLLGAGERRPRLATRRR